MSLIRFFRNRPLVIIVILSVLLIVAAVFTSQNDGSINAVEGIVGEIISPVQKILYSATSYVYNSISDIRKGAN